MNDKIDFKLRVSCVTYNHSSFIGETLDGFCMQKTNFPFLCAVADDASTDGEPELIKRYLDDNFDRLEIELPTESETDEYLRIFARHKENKNCYFCVLLMKYNHFSIGKAKLTSIADLLKPIEYVAICDGDDYWTDPQKLQKQVDFLENNLEFSMCFHNVKVWNQKEGILVDDFITRDVPSETDIYELAKDNYIHTPSVVCRRDNRVSAALSKMGKLRLGDYPTWVLHAQYGKIKKMDECMAVYRFTSGIWSGGIVIHNTQIWIQMLCRLVVVIDNKEMKQMIEQQIQAKTNQIMEYYDATKAKYDSLLNSSAFKLGSFLLKPIYWMKKLVNRNK
ncbi:MAG: glycosyltransferase [Bacteroidales bacterium]|nr:glycosyltransferase [Bacteroidales bacterium]